MVHMAKVQILHDAHGNIVSFAEVPEFTNRRMGLTAAQGQTVTTVEVPGSLRENPAAFTAAVHGRLRNSLQKPS